MPQTETELREWRLGSTIAERLSAGILSVLGYEDIDPQAPLGGPDDGKDILCTKEGKRYVAACYFPNTQKNFADIRAKFERDIDGAKKHSPYAMIFVTNQALTLGQRSELEKHAIENGLLAVLLYLERLRVLLDSPIGYGLRLQFLQIGMSESDQIAFFEAAGVRTALMLDQHKEEIQRISRKLDLLISRTDNVLSVTRRIVDAVGAVVDGHADIKASTFPPVTQIGGPSLSATLTVPIVLAVHRLANQAFPPQFLGRLRTVQVWLGVAGGSPEEAFLKPPPWDQVLQLLSELLKSWNESYEAVSRATKGEKHVALAKFHQTFLSIHPFVDGNGRAARALLEQQCIDMFGAADLSLFEQGGAYINALQQADKGDYSALAALIGDMVAGASFEAAVDST